MELFKLLGTIAIDNAEAKKKLKETTVEGEKVKDNLSKLGQGAAKVGKVIATGLAAGAGAVATLGGFAVNAYAEYEQLAGGAELLFGEAYGYIAEQAKNAYKTVQMSQNEYLQQVNGFSTGLKTALNGNEQAAAELANKIVVAEADIIAATGNSAENVQNAFNGIMKSNFTMLDNLQLGITPTKEGFQQVINKVNEWNKANGEATKYQIDNLADCQSALIDYIEMQGLSGYAAKEASGTIQGSLAMVKGSWDNLLVGLASGNADIPTLVSNVVSSGSQVIKNIIPVAENVIKSLPQAISAISPEAGAAFQSIVDGIMEILPTLKTTLETTFNIVCDVINFMSEHQGLMIGIAAAIGTVVTALGLYNAVQAIKTALDITGTLTLGSLTTAIWANVAATAAMLAPYAAVVAAVAAVIAIGVLLYKNWDEIKAKCSEIWGNITAKFTEIKDNIVGKVTEMKDNAVAKFNEIKDGAKEKFENVKQSVKEKFNAVKETMGTVMEAAKNTVSDKLSNIKSAYDKHGGGIKGVAAAAMEGVKGYYSAGFSFIDNLTGGKLSNIVNSVKTKMESAKAAVSEKLESIKSKFSSIFESAKTIVSNAIAKIKGMFNFSWSLPKIKLPHFKVSGGKAPWGFMGEGSLPKVSVQWYKKAMDTPMLLDRATIFGYSGATGKYLGGGEAGSEMVGGTNTIMKMIQNAVATQNADMLAVLTKILNAILAMDKNMGGHLREALEDMGFEINNREFARLVKAVN